MRAQDPLREKPSKDSGPRLNHRNSSIAKVLSQRLASPILPGNAALSEPTPPRVAGPLLNHPSAAARTARCRLPASSILAALLHYLYDTAVSVARSPR